MKRRYRRFETLPETAQAFIRDIRARGSKSWALTVQTRTSQFESTREAQRWSYAEAFERVDLIFADVTQHGLEQARAATGHFRRWLAERGELDAAPGPALTQTSKGTRRVRSTAPAVVDFAPVLAALDPIAKRLDALERPTQRTQDFGPIVKRLDDLASAFERFERPAPPKSDSGPRANTFDVPREFQRTQLERIASFLGPEAAAQALEINLRDLERALERPGSIPRLDTDRLDEVYVAARVQALDLDVSDLLDEVGALLKTRRRRTLDNLTNHQAS